MRCVIIESPFRTEDLKLKRAYGQYLRRAIDDSLKRREAPFASHGFYTRYLDDEVLLERVQGILCNQSWIRKADCVAVYDNYGISEGMRKGIIHAGIHNIPVEYRNL
jgi:hypothetical protein